MHCSDAVEIGGIYEKHIQVRNRNKARTKIQNFFLKYLALQFGFASRFSTISKHVAATLTKMNKMFSQHVNFQTA